MAAKSTNKTKSESNKIEDNIVTIEELQKLKEELKQFQLDILHKQEQIEKEKEEFYKLKENTENTSMMGNEFIEVICNIPKFTVDDLGAYEIYSRTTNRFIKMPVYGSKCTIQYGDLQDMLGIPDNGLVLGSVLISKNNKKAITNLGLDYIYEGILYPDEIDDFLKKSDAEIVNKISKFPTRMKESFIEILKLKSQEGKFDSISTLRTIEQALNVRI